MPRDVPKRGGFDYRFLFEACPDGMLLATNDGTLLDANPAACCILRRMREDVVAAGLDGVFDPSDPGFGSAMDERRRTGRFKGELRMLRRGATPFPAEVSIVGYRDTSAQDRLGIVFRDVTEGKRLERALRENEERLKRVVEGANSGIWEWGGTVAEKNKERMLRESEEWFRSLVQNASDIITVLDSDGTVLYQSPAIERVFGFRPEETVGTKAFEGLHPDDVERASSLFAEALNTPGVHPPVEFRVPHADGSWRYLENVVSNLLDDPFVRGIVVNSRDITELKEAEEALRESEERFRTTFDLTPLGIAHVGTDGRFLRVNRKLCEIVGYTREELLGKTFQDITHLDDLKNDLHHLRRLLAGEIDIYSMEKRYIRKDHSWVWANLTKSLVRDPSGEPSYFISIIEDITERKHKELLLDSLTPREIEVLRLLAQGYTNREIAESMKFSVGTAKINVQHIINKLGVSDRTQAAVLAVVIGLIPAL